MEQLGPFHLFYTLSCAEMRWPSVLAEVLRTLEKDKIKIFYPEEWNGDAESITVKTSPEIEMAIKQFWANNQTRNENLPAEVTEDISIVVYREWYLHHNKMSMTDFLKDHFILITRIFDKRVKDFHTEVLKKKGIVNYCYRVEFQMRGLPHIHGVAWLDKEQIKDCLSEDGMFREDKEGEGPIIELIDKWMRCSLDCGDDERLKNLVKEVNTHHHTKSCKKYGEFCRYDFPRFFSEKTIISNPLPDTTQKEKDEKEVKLKKREKILKAVKMGYKKLEDQLKDKEGEHEVRNYDDATGLFLTKVCELNPKEIDPDKYAFLDLSDEEKVADAALEIYYEALSISEAGRNVLLKRKISERFTNNYNPLFQSVWQANTDIQLCLDTHAVISYISDYVTKSDQGLTSHLEAALNEKKNCSVFEQLNHVKRTYFTHKQTCVSEAAYRLIPGLNLKDSNIKTMFLTSGFPETRRTYLRQIPEDEQHDEAIEVEGRKGHFQAPTSKIEIYTARPKDTVSQCSLGRLENLCYAEFCMYYEKVTEKYLPKQKYDYEIFRNSVGEEEFGIGYEKNKGIGDLDGLPKFFFFMQNGKRQYMKKRRDPYVMRIYSGKRNDHIEESYSELLLFTAWRDEKKSFYNDHEHFRDIIREMFRKEDDLINEEEVDDEIQAMLQDLAIPRKGAEVERNRKKIYPHSNRITELRKLLEEGDYLTHVKIADTLDPSAEQQDADESEDDEHENKDDEEYPQYSTYDANPRKCKKPLEEEKCIYKQPVLEDVDTLKKNVRSLSFEQRMVFDKYIDFSKKIMCALRYGGNIETNPPRLIVHGGGGVGKSYLINLISQWVHKILSSWGDISQYPKVIRLAATGAAAYLIGNF